MERVCTDGQIIGTQMAFFFIDMASVPSMMLVVIWRQMSQVFLEMEDGVGSQLDPTTWFSYKVRLFLSLLWKKINLFGVFLQKGFIIMLIHGKPLG
jgi:hypothetical protein